MRHILLLGLLLVVSCDDGTTGGLAMDLSVPADLANNADLSGAVDMAQLSCSGILTCIQTTCNNANIATCAPACIGRGSTAAQALFTPFLSCSQGKCYDADGGTNACAVDANSSDCLTCIVSQCGTELSACMAM